MPILWCGSEDIDFPVGGTVVVSTTASHFRAGYARCAIHGSAVYLHSNPFPAGAVTSCWLTFFSYEPSNITTSDFLAGLVLSSTAASGLWVGSSTSSRTRLALFTFDGTTKVQLAAESGDSLSPAVINRIDVQLVNYGATATVNVYLNGTLLITFSGDVRVGALVNIDAVGLRGEIAGGNFINCSEFIVADEDTRSFPGLVTLALTGAGTTDDWTGVYSTINQTTLSDAAPNYTNVSDKDQQFNITDLPAGTFDIKAIKISARAAKAAGTPTQIALGYNSGGAVAVGPTLALTEAYATYEELDSVNPVTGVAFVQSEMNALQLNARSKA